MRHFTSQEVRDIIQKERGMVVIRVVEHTEYRYAVPLEGYSILGELIKEPILTYEAQTFDVTCESVIELRRYDVQLVVDGDDLVVRRETIERGRV